MEIKVGEQIKTVYGWREVVKVNAKSVVVQLDGRTMKIAMSAVSILNDGDQNPMSQYSRHHY